MEVVTVTDMETTLQWTMSTGRCIETPDQIITETMNNQIFRINFIERCSDGSHLDMRVRLVRRLSNIAMIDVKWKPNIAFLGK